MSDLEERLLVGLRSAMKEKKMSLTGLSKRVEIPYRSLQNYFSGNTKMPAVVYVKICEELGIDNHYVLHGSFEFSHNAFRDALLDVIGNGLADVKLRSTSHAVFSADSDLMKKQIMASELTMRLNHAYHKFMQQDFKESYTRGRSDTSTEYSERLGNRLVNEQVKNTK